MSNTAGGVVHADFPEPDSLPELPADDTPLRPAVSWGDTFRAIVSRRWLLATLLVIAGMVMLVRLGFWQLDRLDQRRAFNQMVTARWNMPPYDLKNEGLPADLKELEYRRVEADGVFDYEHQIVLTNQSGPNGEAGVQLVTPMVFDNGTAVLVARGWVPQELSSEENWPTLEEPAGAPVLGLIQQPQTIEDAPAPSGPQRDWYRIDVPLIERQMPYPLLNAFLLQLAEPGRMLDTYPSRFLDLTLDEGSHLSYSIQWFTFALILGFGYIQYVRWQEGRRRRLAEEAAASGTQEAAFDDPTDGADTQPPATAPEAHSHPS